MTYRNTIQGIFRLRPNRFIAHVEVDGQVKVCHVKNTGRCKELLIPGARVILERSQNPARKTEYDLIGVYKGDALINIDSQAPNKVFAQWVRDAEEFAGISLIKPECFYKNSRFDFYLEGETRRIFVEVKGVTLEKDGVVLFPDAPTQRGVKHLNELVDAAQNGYEAYVFFVVQMENCTYFTPNRDTHRAFADALKAAEKEGVKIRCVNCLVTENSLTIHRLVDVVL